jgi:hypothetical protein
MDVRSCGMQGPSPRGTRARSSFLSCANARSPERARRCCAFLLTFTYMDGRFWVTAEEKTSRFGQIEIQIMAMLLFHPYHRECAKIGEMQLQILRFALDDKL